MATTDKKSILRVLREKFKYTQEEVSQYLGISQPAYLKYEMGYTEVSIEGLEKLARLYGMDEYRYHGGQPGTCKLCLRFPS